MWDALLSVKRERKPGFPRIWLLVRGVRRTASQTQGLEGQPAWLQWVWDGVLRAAGTGAGVQRLDQFAPKS